MARKLIKTSWGTITDVGGGDVSGVPFLLTLSDEPVPDAPDWRETKSRSGDYEMVSLDTINDPEIAWLPAAEALELVDPFTRDWIANNARPGQPWGHSESEGGSTFATSEDVEKIEREPPHLVLRGRRWSPPRGLALAPRARGGPVRLELCNCTGQKKRAHSGRCFE